jgi:putative redox protein
MIVADSQENRYLVHFTDGRHHADADVVPAKGGQDAGFGPHDLMEASLATCINMWIGMQADKLGIPVGPISVSVTLKRDRPEHAIFEYSIEFKNALPIDQRATLMKAAENCPVVNTLLKRISFDRRD